jgi:hypothetical protein
MKEKKFEFSNKGKTKERELLSSSSNKHTMFCVKTPV